MKPPQIFQPTDAETENMALNTTQVLVRTIYDQAAGAVDDDIKGFAKDVCEECIKILKEPEKSQAKHAIKVICAFLSTTRTLTILNALHTPVDLFTSICVEVHTVASCSSPCAALSQS